MSRSKSKVLVVNDRFEMFGSYHAPFAHLGDFTSNSKILDYAPERVAAVVFTGGADVGPEHYGQSKGHLTSCSPWRDTYEIAVFKECIRHKLPIFGICRGAQLMCVMAGGTLCQHLTGHGYCEHVVETYDGKRVAINSYHHQMMMPPPNAEVLAWAEPRLSKYYLGGDNEDLDVDREIEVVHFPEINGLAVQYHPELHREYEEGWVYYQDLISDFLYMSKYLVSEGEPPSMLQKFA